MLYQLSYTPVGGRPLSPAPGIGNYGVVEARAWTSIGEVGVLASGPGFRRDDGPEIG
jgi:hypothetical protein